MTDTLDAATQHEVLQRPSDVLTARRVLWFAAAIAALLLAQLFAVEPVRVRSNSMAPSLPSGAVLIVDKLTYHVREPRRGDVIVTNDPRTGESIVKRVVAIGGDSVGLDDGALVVNGARVIEHDIDNAGMQGFYFGPDIVPPGDVFVLGDNRADSIDSRTFGPIAVDDIDGRVVGKIWPFG